MTPTSSQIADALEHASIEAPRESCGVIADGRYMPMRNVETGVDRFAFDMREFHQINKRHRIEAAVHSHVNTGLIASEADRASCERTGLPFVILAWPNGAWRVIEPCGWRAPLEGRQWAWGTQDCYTLVQDALEAYAGIKLPDIDREWAFWSEGEDIITPQIANCGFGVLPPGSQPQHLDVFAMRLGSRVASHLGIFLAPDQMLHHPAGRLSLRENYGPYAQYTVLHGRHERLMKGSGTCPLAAA